MLNGLNGLVGHHHRRERRSSLGSNKSSSSEAEHRPVEEEETVVDDSEKSVLLNIIGQLRPGADLSRITLPTFILEPKSMLERITNFMQHPENLLPIPQIDDPTQRFIAVVKFYLSGWHIKPVGVKKPLNPILGEFYTCWWDFDNKTQAFYVSEQTSHHPPKSSYFYMSPHNNVRIDGTLKPRSRFLGNSAASMMEGIAVLRILNRGQAGGEKYYLTQPNMYVRGILFGRMKYELGDHSYVKCPELDLIADIEFKTKGWVTGGYDFIGGTIKRESTGEILYELSGKWNEEMFIQNKLTGQKELLFDATHAQAVPPSVRPLNEQEERESQKLWKQVTTALNRRDQQTATDEKYKIENRQREEARTREYDGVEWRPRFFRQMAAGEEDEDLDFIIQAHIDGHTPEEQIRQILAIQPIMPGAHVDDRYNIPPHHPHQTSNIAIPTGSSSNAPASLSSSPEDNFSEALESHMVSSHDNNLMSDSHLLDEQALKNMPALVPTTAGVAPAGRLGNTTGVGLSDMGSLRTGLPEVKPAGSVRPTAGTKLDSDERAIADLK